MGLKPGMRVLDVGCGVGGPAREIARFSGAHITGLNNNQFQVERATKYTARAGLSDQVDFVKADFMKLAEHFGPNSFDAVYAIEATVHAPNFEGIYNEIKKVLKPGGIVSGCSAWRAVVATSSRLEPAGFILADTRAPVRYPSLIFAMQYSSVSTSGA